MAFATSSTLIFRIACWLMAIMAFAQIMISGVAIAMRMESTRTVKVVEKIVTSEPQVAINRPINPSSMEAKPTPTTDSAPVTLPSTAEPRIEPLAANLPPPRPLIVPDIADPLAERLVNEARAARVSEDMMTAITKLDQALQSAPNDAHALYELGLCHEAMGIYDKARLYYHQVYQLGTSSAGGLYVQAAEKLKQGFEQPIDKINRVVLGRPRVFKDPNRDKGEKVIITIPVLTAGNRCVFTCVCVCGGAAD